MLDQPCQRFRQTIELLLRESKILDDGFGWVRPPLSLVVQEKVLENARVANVFANEFLFHKRVFNRRFMYGSRFQVLDTSRLLARAASRIISRKLGSCALLPVRPELGRRTWPASCSSATSEA